MTLCVVGRLIAEQTVYLRKYRDLPMKQSFVWTDNRDIAKSMTSDVAVRVMRAAREFCSAPTFALDSHGCIISCGPKILTKEEQKAERRRVRTSTKSYKNVGKTLAIAAEWCRKRYPALKERPRHLKRVRPAMPVWDRDEVVADMISTTVARLRRLKVRPRRRAKK